MVLEDIEYQLPKTWREFCKQNRITKNEVYINNSCIILPLGDENPRCAEGDRNILPNTKAAEQHLALMQLHQLRDCYRQGWLPDCSNTDYIYNIYRDYNIIDEKYEYKIGEYINTEYFLSFQSREIAREFLTNFRELIEQAGDLI